MPARSSPCNGSCRPSTAMADPVPAIHVAGRCGSARPPRAAEGGLPSLVLPRLSERSGGSESAQTESPDHRGPSDCLSHRHNAGSQRRLCRERTRRPTYVSLPVGAPAIAMGWGTLSSASLSTPDLLRWTRVARTPDSTCSSARRPSDIDSTESSVPGCPRGAPEPAPSTAVVPTCGAGWASSPTARPVRHRWFWEPYGDRQRDVWRARPQRRLAGDRWLLVRLDLADAETWLSRRVLVPAQSVAVALQTSSRDARHAGHSAAMTPPTAAMIRKMASWGERRWQVH